MAWKITKNTKLGDSLECYNFITHVRNCVMGATPMFTISLCCIVCVVTQRQEIYSALDNLYH